PAPPPRAFPTRRSSDLALPLPGGGRCRRTDRAHEEHAIKLPYLVRCARGRGQGRTAQRNDRRDAVENAEPQRERVRRGDRGRERSEEHTSELQSRVDLV